MFERLTDYARQVVVLAQKEARALKHDYVGSEHLLLGLLAVQEGVAARALASLGVTLELARERVVRTVGRGEQDSPAAIPFTPRAKRLLALALEEALSLSDDYIGTGHILLAVVREHEAVAARVLRGLGVDLERVGHTVDETPPEAEVRSRTDELQTGGRAGATAATGDDGPRVTITQLDSETFRSAGQLARAFGSPVCEPTWWPADTEEISYCLVRSSGGAHYQIGSTRREGAPICVVGHFEAALAGRSPRDWLSGEWSEPPELAHVRGLIGNVGIPRRLQAVIYDQKLQIQLIGYDNEDEIISAVGSLRRASPE
ncbi:MAG: Clp protease N-terminal domain-containing protein [Solirubrobacteraceae bacterium]